MSDTAFPAIDRWWPHLDIEFKHEILADLDAPLSRQAVAEVARLCHTADVKHPVALSEQDKGYIRTQIELVD